MRAPLPPDEQRRLQLLGELCILDTPPEPSFDSIARLAVQLSGCPIGALCFVDAERLWLKAAVGTEVREVPRDAGFCAHTIIGGETVLIEDASIDARFASIPLVPRQPAIRSYAAAPVLVEGHAVATVAVFDPRPHALDPRTLTGLVDLARLSAELLHGRLTERRRRLQEAPAASVNRDEPAAGAPPAPGSPLQLLYVEDNQVNALLFGEAVRMLGNIELRVAGDGAEAIEAVRDWRPDVLVLDAHLPGMSGYDVLERLRAVPGLERAPAYMCSADAQPDDLARARAAGFVGYWTKPIDVARVIAELQRLAAR